MPIAFVPVLFLEKGTRVVRWEAPRYLPGGSGISGFPDCPQTHLMRELPGVGCGDRLLVYPVH